ncbi:MAG: TOBE domain-containing protein, partial [Rhodospirillales bacterium]|nr:TOBE domain-containing protein [Rhodospirillales bacterium]
EVYRDPRNLFVASFIGSPAMNFLEVELGRGDGSMQCSVGEQTLALPPDLIGGEVPVQAVMGVRPTDLMVEARRELSLRGQVFLVEPVGPVTYVDCDVGGMAVKAVCDPDNAPAIGARVALGFSSSRVYLFDPASDQRL